MLEQEDGVLERLSEVTGEPRFLAAPPRCCHKSPRSQDVRENLGLLRTWRPSPISPEEPKEGPTPGKQGTRSDSETSVQGTCLAQWVEHAALGLKVMSSSPTLNVKPTYTNEQKRHQLSPSWSQGRRRGAGRPSCRGDSTN